MCFTSPGTRGRKQRAKAWIEQLNLFSLSENRAARAETLGRLSRLSHACLAAAFLAFSSAIMSKAASSTAAASSTEQPFTVFDSDADAAAASAAAASDRLFLASARCQPVFHCADYSTEYESGPTRHDCPSPNGSRGSVQSPSTATIFRILRESAEDDEDAAAASSKAPACVFYVFYVLVFWHLHPLINKQVAQLLASRSVNLEYVATIDARAMPAGTDRRIFVLPRYRLQIPDLTKKLEKQLQSALPSQFIVPSGSTWPQQRLRGFSTDAPPEIASERALQQMQRWRSGFDAWLAAKGAAEDAAFRVERSKLREEADKKRAEKRKKAEATKAAKAAAVADSQAESAAAPPTASSKKPKSKKQRT